MILFEDKPPFKGDCVRAIGIIIRVVHPEDSFEARRTISRKFSIKLDELKKSFPEEIIIIVRRFDNLLQNEVIWCEASQQIDSAEWSPQRGCYFTMNFETDTQYIIGNT